MALGPNLGSHPGLLIGLAEKGKWGCKQVSLRNAGMNRISTCLNVELRTSLHCEFSGEDRVISISRFIFKIMEIDFSMNFLNNKCSLKYMLRRLSPLHS